MTGLPPLQIYIYTISIPFKISRVPDLVMKIILKHASVDKILNLFHRYIS